MDHVIVIGAGHNGLTAAARLAKGGRRVTVLEAREEPGGLACGEEFHPGYRHVGVHQETALFDGKVARELNLAAHGYERRAARAPVLFPEEEGPGLLWSEDPRAELESRSPADVSGYERWRHQIALYGKVLVPLWRGAPPDAFSPTLKTLLEMGKTALTLRRLGKQEMLEFLRLAPTCVTDWMNESFEDPLLKAGLALPAVSGTWLAPWSSGSTLNLLLQEMLAEGEVVGGPAGAARALGAAARAAGATVRTGARVREVLIHGGQVRGVELEGGERLEADAVLATCDPKQTLERLVSPVHLSQREAHHIRNFRARGTTAVVHLALSGALEFSSRPGQSFGRARLVTTLDDLERSFDGIKYGEVPARPALEVSVPSLTDRSLAPDGGTVVSILASFVPYDRKEGWDDAGREALGDLVVDTLAAWAPSVRDRIVGRDVLTPVDLETRYGTTGGHIHHGEHALDQLLLRPTPSASRYLGPIGGLYLGGSGNHPGGGLTGLPGWLSAGTLMG